MACRTTRAKRELVRVVRSPAGDLAVDVRGKMPGRGAYVCPEEDRGCLAKGLASGALATALHAAIDEPAAERLGAALRTAAAKREKGG